jgi:hypothetical protein
MPSVHAVVATDGAGWHQQGGRLTLPDNVSLLLLPPYSPELNPQENVWQYLRQNYPANGVFDTYEPIVDACCHAWNSPTEQPERITSIGIAHPGFTTASRAVCDDSTKRMVSRTEARLALAVLTTERKAA